MSIQKITQSEILENGVKSLPTRPSNPSLYSGRTLSAEELKDAFDKLPTLIAERFNALLESTGLFDGSSPADSLAALIATGFTPSHSLKTFFEDVRNGNLALYLNADTGKSLADVLSELRADIDTLQMDYSISITGEGNLITDAEMRGKTLVLHRAVSKENILAEANAYTDARTQALENAGKGILYSYPVQKSQGTYTQVSENALENTAILSFGARPPERENLFPEPILSTFQEDGIRIAWDNEKGELVLNGTLYASSGPLRLSPFSAPVPYEFLIFACFYRGGSVSTDTASITLYDTEGNAIPLSLLQEDVLEYGEAYTAFSHLEIEATEDTVFENYRFNLFLAKEQYFDIRHTPFRSGFGFTMPKKIIAQTPNMWCGGTPGGETYASFTLPPAPKSACYVIGLFPHVDYILSRPYSLMKVYSGEEEIFCEKIRGGNFYLHVVEPTSPITEVRIYAKETEEESVGHTIFLKNLYIGMFEYWDDPSDITYEKGYRDELILPESFSRFGDLFMGMDSTMRNFFNFETGVFHELVGKITLDGTLVFEKDASVAGRFSAPYEAPSDILEEDYYLPSALFQAKTTDSYDECLWFADGRVYVQSVLFEKVDAAAVTALFAACPIEVIYKLSTAARHPFNEEEMAFWEPPILHVAPRSYVYFSENGDDAINVFTEIQYQIKKT